MDRHEQSKDEFFANLSEEKLDKYLEELDLSDHSRSKPLFRTGLKSLDNALGGGLHKGITVLAGMPGSGKSTLAAQIQAQLVEEKSCEVRYFDLETNGDPIRDRLLLNNCDVKNHKRLNLAMLGNKGLLSFEDKRELYKAMWNREYWMNNTVYDSSDLPELLEDANELVERHKEQRLNNEKALTFAEGDYERAALMGYVDTPDIVRLTPHDERYPGDIYYTKDGVEVKRADVMAIWNTYTREDRPKLVIVDYLQLIKCTSYPSDQTSRIRAVMGDLRHVVNHDEGSVSILAISTLSRDGYNKPFSMQSTYGSSDIEYSAEAVITLADSSDEEIRELLNPDLDTLKRMEKEGLRFVFAYISKNRHGKQGVTIPLLFDGSLGRFYEPTVLKSG